MEKGKKYYDINEYGEEIPILLNMTETAKYINNNWDRRLLHVYIKRGKFIEPSFIISKKKYWSLKRIEKYIEKINEEKNS